MKALLANGADVNERTGGGQTPLILATIFNHTHLIPLLLDAGADPQLRDNLGLNAIDWAQRRGATEAIDLLSNKRPPTAQARTEFRQPTAPPKSISSVEPSDERTTFVSEEERSRRWITGLKQRIAEQSQRDLPDGPNIFRQQPAPPPDSQSQLASAEHSWQSQFASDDREPQPEIPAEPSTPQPEIPATPETPKPEIPAPSPDPQPEIPAQPSPSEPTPESPAEPPATEVQLATPNTQTTPRRTGRKRCPKCNATYNSDLISYCAHHIVALVDDDEPPIISEPQSTTSPVMFWMIVIITLIGSVVIGSIGTAFFYSSKPVQPAVTASQPPPNAVQKGTPVVSKELEGKVVSLPIAECPLRGQEEAIPGTVVVRVGVEKTGQVKEAHASGGDWLLRAAATEAAMKSSFAADKLRGRDTEGTITYIFEP